MKILICGFWKGFILVVVWCQMLGSHLVVGILLVTCGSVVFAIQWYALSTLVGETRRILLNVRWRLIFDDRLRGEIQFVILWEVLNYSLFRMQISQVFVFIRVRMIIEGIHFFVGSVNDL